MAADKHGTHQLAGAMCTRRGGRKRERRKACRLSALRAALLVAVLSGLGSECAAADPKPGDRVIVISESEIGLDNRVLRHAHVGDVLTLGAVNKEWAFSVNDRGWIRRDAVALPDRAVLEFTRRLRTDDDPAVREARGVAYFELKQWDKALADFDALAKIDSPPASVWNHRGSVYLQLQRYDAAEADFGRAIARNPKLGVAYNNRSIARAATGQFAAALDDAQQAVNLEPENPAFLNTRGAALRGLGEFALALDDFNAALKLNPQYPKALANRGTVRKLQGDWSGAREDFEAALKVNGRQPFVLNELAWLLATCPEDSLRDGKRAVQLAEQACRLTNRKDFNYLDTLAAAQAENGQFALAKVTAKQAIRLAPEHLKRELQARLALYEKKQPYRSARSAAASAPASPPNPVAEPQPDSSSPDAVPQEPADGDGEPAASSKAAPGNDNR